MGDAFDFSAAHRHCTDAAERALLDQLARIWRSLSEALSASAAPDPEAFARRIERLRVEETQLRHAVNLLHSQPNP